MKSKMKNSKIRAFLILASSIIMIFLSLLLNSNATDNKMWDIVADYKATAIIDPSIVTIDDEYFAGIKYKDFFALEEKGGGVLVILSDLLKFPELTSVIEDKNNFFRTDQHAIIVNNNYLEINPIYDIESSKVSFANNDNTLNILVPEKYKKHEEEILNTYKEWYRFKYYIDDVVHSGAEDSMKVIQSYDFFDVNIVYILDNQTYFSMNKKLGDDNNMITDVICVVVNGSTLGGDFYLSAISQGDYYIYLNNDTDMMRFEKNSRSAGVYENIVLKDIG